MKRSDALPSASRSSQVEARVGCRNFPRLETTHRSPRKPQRPRHWSESIKEPRGRSRSQSYSQIALLHSHLFLHDQLTFADISGTDRRRPFKPQTALLHRRTSVGSEWIWREPDKIQE